MKNILVVDDSKMFADGLSELLRDVGHKVTTMYDPASAIEAIRNGVFDIVITDKDMHGDHNAGFEVVRAARARGDMPIVMISGGVSAATLPVVQKQLGDIGGNIQFVDKSDTVGWCAKVLAVVNGTQKAPGAINV